MDTFINILLKLRSYCLGKIYECQKSNTNVLNSHIVLLKNSTYYISSFLK